MSSACSPPARTSRSTVSTTPCSSRTSSPRARRRTSSGRPSRSALEPGERSLSLDIGPLRAGGGKALIIDAAVPGVGNVIEQLSDEVTIAAVDGSEHLLVRLAYAD